MFEIVWHSGDRTWEPLSGVRHLDALKQYYEALGIDGAGKLPWTHGTEDKNHAFEGVNNTSSTEILVSTAHISERSSTPVHPSPDSTHIFNSLDFSLFSLNTMYNLRYNYRPPFRRNEERLWDDAPNASVATMVPLSTFNNMTAITRDIINNEREGRAERGLMFGAPSGRNGFNPYRVQPLSNYGQPVSKPEPANNALFKELLVYLARQITPDTVDEAARSAAGRRNVLEAHIGNPDWRKRAPNVTSKKADRVKANKQPVPSAIKTDRARGRPTDPRVGRNAPVQTPKFRRPVVDPPRHRGREPIGAGPQVNRSMNKISTDLARLQLRMGDALTSVSELEEKIQVAHRALNVGNHQRQGSSTRNGLEELGTNGQIQVVDRPTDQSVKRSDRLRTDLDSTGVKQRTTVARTTALVSRFPAIPLGSVVASTELERYRSPSVAPSEFTAVLDGPRYRPLVAEPRARAHSEPPAARDDLHPSLSALAVAELELEVPGALRSSIRLDIPLRASSNRNAGLVGNAEGPGAVGGDLGGDRSDGNGGIDDGGSEQDAEGEDEEVSGASGDLGGGLGVEVDGPSTGGRV
ncbi:hypothetical protein RhiJN_10373 [Ceratobasidium sp. AG-Ba]|nr:hypothetical protein RhiJN_10373 [Ceratobasidium sp. AG-Ba]QRW11089.1 hypothetical protein RhiLY_10088 [Ceratobasidium sp. AG-Ba]